MLAGGCCLPFCVWLTYIVVLGFVITGQALSKWEPLVATIPCTANADLMSRPPHHLQGCELKGTNIGGFAISTAMRMCGDLGADLMKGKVKPGTRLSFFGNASNNMLTLWEVPDGNSVCMLDSGSHGPSTLIGSIRWKQFTGFWNFIIMAWAFGTGSAAWLFFPDDVDNNMISAAVIASVALLMAIFLSIFRASWGISGLLFGMVLLLPFLAACFSETALGAVRQIWESAPAPMGPGPDLEDPGTTERTPLLDRPSDAAAQRAPLSTLGSRLEERAAEDPLDSAASASPQDPPAGWPPATTQASLPGASGYNKQELVAFGASMGVIGGLILGLLLTVAVPLLLHKM